MSRGVNLWHYSDSSHSSISYHSFEVSRTEHSSNATTFTQFWHFGYIHWETILINYVPMEHIEFKILHTINGMFDGIKGKEVPGGINHESSPQILRTIGDSDRYSFDIVLAIFLVIEQLSIGL